nr:hypothetical protein [uncultured Ruminococcus sp.]
MSKNNVYSADNKQLDIVDEAIDLMEAAGSEVCEMTFADALEVMKIERLDLLRKELNLIVGRINVVANAIHERY